LIADRERGLRWAARRWLVAEHPYALHCLRAEDWALTVDPGAGEEIVLAALLHDYERAVPDPGSRWTEADWDDPVYLTYHQERSAELASAWMVDHGVEPDRRLAIAELIRTHELGGEERERNVVQAADSLSFLEVNGPRVAEWISSGRVDPDSAEAKVRWMHDRIRLEDDDAARFAGELLDGCLASLGR
jgi:hypothetical protein